jgi:hypothetical protein
VLVLRLCELAAADIDAARPTTGWYRWVACAIDPVGGDAGRPHLGTERRRKRSDGCWPLSSTNPYHRYRVRVDGIAMSLISDVGAVRGGGGRYSCIAGDVDASCTRQPGRSRPTRPTASRPAYRCPHGLRADRLADEADNRCGRS